MCQSVSEPTKGGFLCQAVSVRPSPFKSTAPGNQSAPQAKRHAQASCLARPGGECGSVRLASARRAVALLTARQSVRRGRVFAMRTLLFARPDPYPHHRHGTPAGNRGGVRLGGSLRKAVFWKVPPDRLEYLLEIDGSGREADCVRMARFTAATARENAAKAHAARRQRLASGNPAAETFPQAPQVGPHEAANDYVSRRLARVRVQLDLVDRRITEQANAKTVDGQVLNWLCSAQERLAEQERVLAGRPLPGSRKPAPDRGERRGPGAWLSPVVPVVEVAQVVELPAAQAQPSACDVLPTTG